MKTYLIPHTDLVVSRIAYGCASLIDWNNQPVSPDDVKKAERAIHTAYDSGITLFDHADFYGFGKSESDFSFGTFPSSDRVWRRTAERRS